jgi:hypothetical protein
MIGRHIRYIPGIDNIRPRRESSVLVWRWGLALFCVVFWAAVLWFMFGA